MANAADMTTLNRAAQRLRVSTSDSDLPTLITAASKALVRYLGYAVERRTGVVESAVGHGGVYLWLESGALQEVTSVTVGGSALATTSYALDGTYGALRGRLVARGGYRWPFTGESTGGVNSTPFRAYDTGEILVTFTSGWVSPGQAVIASGYTEPLTAEQETEARSSVTLPEELEQAALEVVTAWYRSKGHDPNVTSRSTGDASIGYGGDAMRGGRASLPLVARELADYYRKVPRSA